MIKQAAISKMLNIKDQVKTEPNDMAADITLTVFPFDEDKKNDEVIVFYKNLKDELEELGVEFIPFNQSLFKVSLLTKIRKLGWMAWNNVTYIAKLATAKKANIDGHWMGIAALKSFLKEKRIKPGVSVISLGEYPEGGLPMDYTSSFKRTSVITIMQMPDHITRESSFTDHFETALDLFAHHMTNIVIGVSKDNWLLYNFNASHPIFSRQEDFRHNILQALIPKIYAPINPPELAEFNVKEESFEIDNKEHWSLVGDIVNGGNLLGNTGLYPDGKLLKELPFRNSFYEWIGKLHIDKRNGMSFGFLARQMPTETSSIVNSESFNLNNREKQQGYFSRNNKTYIILGIDNKLLAIQHPEVWVLTQRSGSDKTNMHPVKDLIKIGLDENGLHLHTPRGVSIEPGYRPSFDTRVILAHALGNAIAASLFNHFDINRGFVDNFTNKGMALAHWHGYIHNQHIPENIHSHGKNNPHVSCSSPQSAMYALQGKMKEIKNSIKQNKRFEGDIHVEPHHGINISCSSLARLGLFLNKHKKASKLGNEYLSLNKAT